MSNSTYFKLFQMFLKNDKRSFIEQQTWLYLFGSFIGVIAIVFNETTDNVSNKIQVRLEYNFFAQMKLSIFGQLVLFEFGAIPLLF